MQSVKDMLSALSGAEPLSFRDAIAPGVYPLVHGDRPQLHSVKAWCNRFSNPGHALRRMAAEEGNAWADLSRAVIVDELRQRLRNPFVMEQRQTDLCGPFSILVEFALRRPTLYVNTAADLLRTGTFSAGNDKVFVADEDLRQRPKVNYIAEVDWMFAATMRDSENISDDIDDAQGLEGLTMPLEIEDWIAAVLRLDADYFPCWVNGEIDALAQGQAAINAGGMAILAVDSNLLHAEAGDREEAVWVRRRKFGAGGPGRWSKWKHVMDDSAMTPDHYVVLVSTNLEVGEAELRVVVWSFGKHYQIKGTREAFAEYLFTVLTGRP